MKSKSMGFIGGGRITKVFLQGFINKNVLPENVKVYEPNADTLSALQKFCPVIEIAESVVEAADQDIVFLAVHPPAMMETLQNIKNVVSESTVVISVSPKISLEKMAAVLPTKKLVRIIPNATSFINKGFNPVTFFQDWNEKEKKVLLKLLKKLGKTFETDEAKLEGYAIVSAMLPTYFWFQWQAMEAIAVEIGLTPEEGEKAVKETLKCSASLFYNSSLTQQEVMDLIPIKPIGEHEEEIKNILKTKLIGLFEKIKP